MAVKPKALATHELETVAQLRLALRRFQAATDEVTRAHGLTSRQYDLLAVLHAPSRRGALASEIADDLGISRNAMTELVSRAAKAGLVRRSIDQADGRRKPLLPTRTGTRRYRAAVDDLRPDRDQLLGLLRRAAGKARKLTPDSA